MKRLIILTNLIITLFYSINSTHLSRSDPFASLGIPSLDPRAIFEGDYKPTSNHNNRFGNKLNNRNNRNSVQSNNSNSPIKSVEDIPKYLQSCNLSPQESLKVISKFLISDDFILKKYGVIFDISGFDGISELNETPYPEGTKQRNIQRARSSANIYYVNNYRTNNNGYDAYGAEKLNVVILPGWEEYKVLMIGKSNVNQNIFVRVCLPMNEMLPALTVSMKEQCSDKIAYVDEANKRNEMYLKKISENYLGRNISDNLNTGNNINGNSNNKYNGNINSNLSKQIQIQPQTQNDNLKIQTPPTTNSNINTNTNTEPSFLMKSEVNHNSKNNENINNNVKTQTNQINQTGLPFTNPNNPRSIGINNTQHESLPNDSNISMNMNMSKQIEEARKTIAMSISNNSNINSNLNIDPTSKNLRGSLDNKFTNPKDAVNQLINNSNQINKTSSPSIPTNTPTNTPNFNYQGLQTEVNTIEEKLKNLENRVGQDEKIETETSDEVKSIKSSIDKNFNKLDNVLEKIAQKLK